MNYARAAAARNSKAVTVFRSNLAPNVAKTAQDADESHNNASKSHKVQPIRTTN